MDDLGPHLLSHLKKMKNEKPPKQQQKQQWKYMDQRFWTLDNRQQRTVIPEKRETSEMSPTLAPAHHLKGLQSRAQGGGQKSLSASPSWEQSWRFGEAKVVRKFRSEYWGGESLHGVQSTAQREGMSELWRATEHSLSLPSSIDQHVCVTKPPRPGKNLQKGVGRTITKTHTWL